MICNSRKQRQLNNLVKIANRKLSSNGGFLDSHILRLKSKIQKLVDELRFVMGKTRLRRILGSLAFVLSISIGTSNGQQFAEPVLNSFGIQNTNTADLFADFDFVDLDGDGDFDLVGSSKYYETDDLEYYGSVVVYLENNGTSESANFLPAVPISNTINWGFDEVYLDGYLSSINSVDIDGDGDFDLLITHSELYAYDDSNGNNYSASKVLIYIENTGTSTMPLFESVVVNPFGINLESINYPGSSDADSPYVFIEFSDIDNDGDLDIIGLVGDLYSKEYYAATRIYYCENSGTSESPSFEEAEFDLFGLTDALPGIGFSISAIDLDMDGDLDLVTNQYIYSDYSDYCDYCSELYYIENSGNTEEANFAEGVIAPFNLFSSQDYNINNTKFSDIDSDGDYDAFHLNLLYVIFDNDQSIVSYQENITPSGLSSETDHSKKKLTKVVDALGREVNHTTNQILFHIYDDGSVEKKFIVE
jgi:hypothetical protein